jgi:hypothetical protein
MSLESPILRDGDAGFAGYASRINPVALPAGMLQLSENMRLDRGVAVTRKGAKRMADAISVASSPLTVPFVLNPAPNAPVVQSVYSGGIFAASVYRSPDQVQSAEIVVLAGGDRAYTILLDDNQSFAGVWAGGFLVTAVSQGSEEIVDENGDTIVISVLPQELGYPTSPDEVIEPTDTVSMVQANDRLYLFREADASRPNWVVKNVTTGGITVSSTTATVNLTGHGFPAGARVRIEGSTVAAFDGVEYDIATASTNSFTITVPSGTATDATTSGRTIRRVKAPLYWDGITTSFVRSPAGVTAAGPTYKTMRSTPWGTYVNNRLVLPDGKNNVLISDILDANTYDPYWQSFRAGAGSNDFVVAVHPWVENSFLVFCRKSIWLAEVNQFASVDGASTAIDTALSKLTLLTDEVGCAARRSIATAGQFVYFLSDSGVYRLDSRLDLKLRGDTKPLSDPIANQLDDLNATLLKNSVGLWYSNRYYLAVPLAGADNNNGVFLYNALNDQWETRDIYGFGVDDFVVATRANERRLFVSNKAGRLMLLDEIEEGDQSPDVQADVITPVAGRIVTRRYGMGSGMIGMTTKRFVRSLADVVLPNTASVTVKAITVNPDAEITLVQGQTNTSGLAEDYTLKQPIRQKAHYCELEFLTTANRPEIRNVSIEAAGPSNPPTETRNAA